MFLIHKNTKIAKIDNNLNIVEIYDINLMPLNCSLGKNIQCWINSRSIDNHRPTSRRLKRMLRLKQTDIIVNNSISITDNWWILNDDNQNLNYYDLKKYNETIAETIIQGISSKQIKVDLTTDYCELGTTGSYEKCWKFIDSKWIMFKENNVSETLSELYSSAFLTNCGFNVVKYSMSSIKTLTGLIHNYTICEDFTNNAMYDFEPLCNLVGENTDIAPIINKLENLTGNDVLAKQYLTIILCDLIVYNVDRHNQNLGLLRDSLTGEIISLAPNYDLNQTLIASGSLNSNSMIKYSLPEILELPDNYILFLRTVLTDIKDKLDVALANTSKYIHSIEWFKDADLTVVEKAIKEAVAELLTERRFN